jgi:hypothetical protein
MWPEVESWWYVGGRSAFDEKRPGEPVTLPVFSLSHQIDSEVALLLALTAEVPLDHQRRQFLGFSIEGDFTGALLKRCMVCQRRLCVGRLLLSIEVTAGDIAVSHYQLQRQAVANTLGLSKQLGTFQFAAYIDGCRAICLIA